MFEQYIVTADYKKKNKNDISLTAGDIVDVIERNDYGENNGKVINLPNHDLFEPNAIRKSSTNHCDHEDIAFSIVSHGLVCYLV